MLDCRRIESALALRGEDRFRKTPLHFPASMNRRGWRTAQIYLKLELFQRTGSFKVRGATTKILSLSEKERAAGIVAASAGNHAQGVALAAASVGAQATIVMPEFAPLTKREATENYGADVVLHGATFDEACAHAQELCDTDGGTFVHAFDDEIVMAGQGTIALEILDDLPDVEAIICPVGGGGLISGIATAIKAKRPATKIIGVQAKGADSAVASFHAGQRLPSEHAETIADGIKVQHVGELCFDIIHRLVDEMVTVDDTQICNAMLMMDEHAHICAEPAGATALAALMSGQVRPPAGPCVVVVSGGNLDTFEKTRYIRRALVEQKRHLSVRLRLIDRRGSKPREMARLFTLLGVHEMNVLDIAYRRDSANVPLGQVEIELLLETRGAAHARAITDALQKAGYELV
ncbi:MAG: threonine ammonia-lyase [Planctomycetota bacterium]